MKDKKIKGVFFENANSKYRAFIHVNNQKIWLGYFSNEADAIQARLNAERYYKNNFMNLPWGMLNFYKTICDHSFEIDDNSMRHFLLIALTYLTQNNDGLMFQTYATRELKKYKNNDENKDDFKVPSFDYFYQETQHFLNGFSLNYIAKMSNKPLQAVKSKIVEDLLLVSVKK